MVHAAPSRACVPVPMPRAPLPMKYSRGCMVWERMPFLSTNEGHLMVESLPTLNAYDWVAILVLLLSMLVGLMRGVVRESASLAAWAAAFLVARHGAEPLARHAAALLQNSAVRLALAFIVLFVVTLVGMGLLGQALAALLRRAGLGVLDRCLGAAFGVVRAALILMVLVMLAALTGINQQPDWRRAATTAWLEQLTARGLSLLPAALASHIPLHAAAADRPLSFLEA